MVASILPVPNFVAYDQNGNPLSGGFVTTLIPGGGNKTTWADAAQQIPNSNPIVLDANGAATIYGVGTYQLVTTDALGNAIPAYSGATQDLDLTAATVTVTTLNASTVNATTVNTPTINVTTLNATNANVTGGATTLVNGTTGSDEILLVENSNGSQALAISGNAAVFFPSISGFTTGFSANLAVVGNLLSLCVSSARYKRDIQPFPEPLAAARKLRAVRFRSRSEDDGDTVFAGMIAEDVHDAGLTEFVTYDNLGRPDAVHYGPLAALAISAVSDLADIVDDLRRRIAALEGMR